MFDISTIIFFVCYTINTINMCYTIIVLLHNYIHFYRKKNATTYTLRF